MDLVRGIAITLVILLHAVVITDNRDDVSLPTWTAAANDAVAPFRIPVLVLLSGMLLPRSLEKGTVRFAEGKLRRIAWPFLVWTAIFVVLRWPGDVSGVLGYLGGATYLWYLLFLLIYYAAAWVLRPVPALLVVGVALVLAVLAPDDTKYAERLVYLFGLFMLGSLVVQRPRLWAWLSTSRGALLLAAGLLALQVPLGYGGAGLGPQTLFATLGGLLIGVQVARRVGTHRVLSPFRFVGRTSLVYYVVHFPVIVVTVAVARAVGIEEGAVLVAGAALVALATGTLFALGRERRPLSWLFVAPRRVGLTPVHRT